MPFLTHMRLIFHNLADSLWGIYKICWDLILFMWEV
jgi:hypothetical protein